MTIVTKQRERAALNEIKRRGHLDDSSNFNAAQVPPVIKHLLMNGLIARGSNGKKYVVVEPTDTDAATTKHLYPAPTEKPSDEIETTAKRNAFTSEDLRESLVDTLKGLKAGDVTIEEAKAASDVAGKILDSAKVELAYKLAQKQHPGIASEKLTLIESQ